MKILIYLWLFICFSSIVYSQTACDTFLLGPKYGISGFYDYNMQSVDMRQLSTVPDSVPRSATGSKPGFSIGAYYEYRLTDRTSILFRGIYTKNTAEISGNTPETLKLNGFDTLGHSKHTLVTDLSNVKIEPIIKYRLFSRFSLFGGFNAGLRFDKSFTHKEIVYDPSGASFPNGLPYRNGVDEDKKDNLGLQAALVFGFSFDIPVNFNGKYLIMPEMLFETGFSDITSSITWDVNTVRAGLTLMYSKNPTVIPKINTIHKLKEDFKVINKEIADIDKESLKPGKTYITFDTVLVDYDLTIFEISNRTDTLCYPKKASVADTKKNGKKTAKDSTSKDCLKIYSLGSDGKTEFPDSKLKVEEFLSTSIQPLLNYVFFEHNSAIIPSRFDMLNKNEINLFKIEDLRNLSTLRTYHHILNIIGKRLNDNSDAKITLTGCNSGVGEEKNNLDLSASRARAVKNYLMEAWGIESDRIKVQSVNFSDKASNINDSDGVEENRRVEITSSSWEVIAPVIINDTLRDVNPPQIRFYNNANNCYKIANWNLNVYQSGKALIGFRGEENIPERIIWRLSDAKQTVPKGSQPVTYNIEFVDYNGEKIISKTDTIPIDQITISEKNLSNTADKKVDKYSLILFDFDKAVLNQSNEKIMSFINQRIKNISKVSIQGYTDRMGNDDYNLQLSQRRATTVASKIENTKNIKNEGLGEQDLIYNNELPEGRFYCRTVMITVETPLK